MSADYVAAFVFCVALGCVGGAYRPWRRFPLLSDTPGPVRAIVLGSVAAGLFLVFSLLAGLFYFLSGPTSPVPIALFTSVLTLLFAAILVGDAPG